MKNTKRGNENSYWTWVYNHQWSSDDYAKELWEPVEANPDQATEEFFPQKTEEELEEEQIKDCMIKFIVKNATRREKDVIKLLRKGYDQMTIARKLRVASSTINNIVFQIRNKIQKLIDKKPKLGVVMQDRKIL